MAKPTTIRIPEDLLNEIDRFVHESKLDRSAYLREVLRKGFSLDKQERLLLKYVRKELSQAEVCKELKCLTDVIWLQVRIGSYDLLNAHTIGN